MQTIKSFIVVALLLAVCYGAFVALNAPEVDIPAELEQWANSSNGENLMDFEIPEIEFPSDFAASDSLGAGDEPYGVAPKSGNTLGELPTLPTFPDVGSPAQSTPLPDGTAVTGLPTFPSGSSQSLPAADSFATESTPPAAAIATGDSLLPDANEMVGGPDIPTLPGTDGPSVPFDAGASAEVAPPASSTTTPGEFVSTTNNLGLKSDVSLPLLDEASPSPVSGSSSATSGGALASDNSSQMSSDRSPVLPFEIAREQALMKASAGALRDSLEMLSEYYESPELGYAEHSDLVDILDALSREVIYSGRHLLRAPYTVQATDTLASLAEKHRITPELLGAINGLGTTGSLTPNSQIKVIDGPFNARISLSRGELTLFLNQLYAGRFPIAIAKENAPAPGIYQIGDRRRDRTYYGASNVVIPADDPSNPYGGYWLSLGTNLSIHGSPEMVRSDLEQAGCISLAPLDAADVYNILAKNCQVEIRL